MGTAAAERSLVGRWVERETLVGCVRRVASGRGGSVLIEGEAGIGKTRLLDEALASAEALGVRALRGTARELERSRPFGPLAQALGLQRSALDADRARIAHLLWGELDDPSLDSGAARAGAVVQYRIIEAILSLVERLSVTSAVIVAVEDLHWADVSTLLTLNGIGIRLRHLPVLVMGTLRPLPRDVELDSLVHTLVAQGGMHMTVGGLDTTEVEVLAAALAGARPGTRLRAELLRTGGNPLFVTELLRTLAQDGVLVVDRGRAEIVGSSLPPSLRLVLLRRLSYLPRVTLELLRVAAVLGSHFEVAHLSLVTGRSTVELLPALDEALRAGVLGEAGGHLAFRHDLIWEALYRDLAPAIRNCLHRDSGRALASAGAPALQVAEHLAAGALPGDREAVRWLHDAGLATLPRDPRTAATLLQRAVDIADPADRQRDTLLAELVVARLWAGRSQEAETLARQILDRHHDLSIDSLVRLNLMEALIHQSRHFEAADEGRRALDHSQLSGGPRAQLRAEMAYGLMFAGDLEGAAWSAEVAKEEGERVGDDRARCVALDVLATVALYQGRTGDAVRLAAGAAERAQHARTDPAQRIHAHTISICHYVLALTLFSADRLDEAEEAIHEGRQIGEDLGNALGLPLYQWLLTLLRFRNGQWDDAIAEAEAGFALAEGVQTRFGVLSAYGVLAMIAFHRNDLCRAEALLIRGEAEMAGAGPHPHGHWLRWARALIEESRDDLEAALRTLGEAWRSCTQVGALAEYPLLGPDLVRVLLVGHRSDDARGVTEQVEQVAARIGSGSARGAALRCRGLVEADHEVLAESVAVLRQGPYPLPMAQACEDAAAATATAGHTADAAQLLAEALATYEGLGAVRDAARVEAGLRALGVRRGRRGRRRDRAQQGWESLTETELQVVGLIVEGLTTREAAQRLFISPRTVETHLSHVFAKLNLSSRVQLRAEAAGRRRSPATVPAAQTALASSPASR